jgi:sigma-E factor negative regulatory protein RseB
MALTIFLPGALPVWAADNPAQAANDQATDDSQLAASIDPVELLEAMSVALNTLNYEGTFVHAQGSNLTSMHILHSSDSTGELERLRALDGEAREVVRNNALVTCIWPDSQSVFVSQSKPRDLLPKLDATFVNNEGYEFKMMGSDRVAGRDTHILDVIPRDGYRYGYRFWVDQQTDMLLRSMVLDGPDNPVEQILFTQIDYPDSIDVASFDINDDRASQSWFESKNSQAVSGFEKIAEKVADKISFNGLPAGYQEVSETFSPIPIKDGPVSHVMLSDGMASVSVYVEYVGEAEQSTSSLGLMRMGAMSAYGLSTERALITVVGEVPSTTVKVIASAVQMAE